VLLAQANRGELLMLHGSYCALHANTSHLRHYGAAMTDGTPQSTPSPDWYPDPSTPGQLRFWDGTAWTAHVKLTGPAVPVMPAPSAASAAGSESPRATEPAPKKLANRAAGFGMVGVLLLAIGVVLAIFIGLGPVTIALIVGGAIVFLICLALCVVFTILKR